MPRSNHSQTLRKPLLLRTLCAIALPLILQACGHLIPSRVTEGAAAPAAASFCDVAKPIVFSRLHDTAETIEQVKAHNAKGEALCGWGVK
jgi:hypothetical protein